MPTGYTAKLMEEGQTLPEFVLGCARAFGALIEMRDDAPDAKIPDEFKPSTHCVAAKEKASRVLAKLRKMTVPQRRKHGNALKKKRLAELRAWLKRDEQANKRLDMISSQLNVWTPPTPEHVGLSTFMNEQIRISRNDTGYIRGMIRAESRKSPMAYWQDEVSSQEHSVAFYAEEQKKEIERVRGRNEWVALLRKSLEEFGAK